ncbi:mucin-5AC-like isoform X2 [Dreissena polymorpha]|uniref:mucin-5AC-like isoform X2 n=1 Tax=Dreissena polymorpha TaxID=45954 RepID=UPI0022653A9B|nr:mucin-5AC-like isoform X2 [Dreissena polymorpha]
MIVTTMFAKSFPNFNCSNPAFCICEKLTPTTATMGTTTTPQPSSTIKTTLTTTTTTVTSQQAGIPVATSSGVGTTPRSLDRCEEQGSQYWSEVKGYAYCLSNKGVSCCDAKTLCQTNNGSISSNVGTKENFVEIAHKLGLSNLTGTLTIWANLTGNTCSHDQLTQCKTISYIAPNSVDSNTMTEAKTYRVLCEKPLSHSTTSIPISSALNTLSLSQTQSTPRTTIKTSIEQTQSNPTMLSTTYNVIFNTPAPNATNIAQQTSTSNAPAPNTTNTAQQPSTSNTPTPKTSNTAQQTSISNTLTPNTTHTTQQTSTSNTPSPNTSNTVQQTSTSNTPTTLTNNAALQTIASITPTRTSINTESRWIRDNLNEYFVNYNNLTLSKARAFCKMSNATLVAFLDAYQYFKLTDRLQLEAAGYWIDDAMPVDNSTCLKLNTSEGSLQSRDCSELAYSICNRFAFQNNISQVLERPEFVEMIRGMTVVKNSTSMATRKLTSAEDKRTVAKVGGTVAICIMAGTFLIIFLSDCSRILKTLFK